MLTPLAVSTQIRPTHAFQLTYHRPQETLPDPRSAILCSGNSLGLPTTITTAFSCYCNCFLGFFFITNLWGPNGREYIFVHVYVCSMWHRASLCYRIAIQHGYHVG